MADTLWAPGYVKSGHLFIRHRTLLDQRFADWKDGNVLATFERVGDPRTLALNKFYWGTAIEIASEFHGYQKDEMHELLASRFLRTVSPDHRKARRKSTASLDNRRFLNYLEDIRVFELEHFDVQIPEPGELILCDYSLQRTA